MTTAIKTRRAPVTAAPDVAPDAAPIAPIPAPVPPPDRSAELAEWRVSCSALCTLLANPPRVSGFNTGASFSEFAVKLDALRDAVRSGDESWRFHLPIAVTIEGRTVQDIPRNTLLRVLLNQTHTGAERRALIRAGRATK